MNINLDKSRVIFGVNEVGASHFLINNFIGRFNIKDYLIFAEQKSHQFLKNNSLEFQSTNIDENIFETLVKKFNPDLIITGASIGLNIEKKLVKFAQKNRIKSFSFIDANVNLWQRFVTDEPLKKWTILPSAIIVDDEYIKKRLIKLNCPLKIIKIKKEENINNIFFQNRRNIKNNFEFDFQYIFLIHETGIKKSNKWEWDNDEEIVDYHMSILIKILIDKINTYNKGNQKIKLIIKAHPSDETNFLREKIFESNFNDFIFINDFEPLNHIDKALMIIGIGSKLLFNSALVNNNTYSFKLNNDGSYPFTERCLHINKIRSKSELHKVLLEVLNKEK